MVERRRTYKNMAIPCPEPGCNRTFKTPQGLSGHLRQIHGIHTAPGELQGVGQEIDFSSPESAALRADVQRLQLLRRRQQLMQDMPPVRTPDISEQSGLGPFSEDIKTQIQSRAFQTAPQQPGWLQSLLSSPQGIATLVSAVKGVLGVSDTNPLAILNDLGLNLGELIKNALHPPPPIPSGIRIGDFDLSGAPLSEAVILSLVKYQEAKEAAAAVAQQAANSQAAWREFMELVKEYAPQIGQYIGSHAQGVGRQPPPPPEQEMLPCKNCNTPVDITGVPSGGQVTCANCSSTFTIQREEEPEPQPKRRRKQAGEVETGPEQATMECCQCGQQIDVTGRQLGTGIECPICGTSQLITNPEEPMAPKEQP